MAFYIFSGNQIGNNNNNNNQKNGKKKLINEESPVKTGGPKECCPSPSGCVGWGHKGGVALVPKWVHTSLLGRKIKTP